jgi:hypothetical protein
MGANRASNREGFRKGSQEAGRCWSLTGVRSIHFGLPELIPMRTVTRCAEAPAAVPASLSRLLGPF